MNLWLRLLNIFFKSLFSRQQGSPSQKREVSFRVMPWDCDINGHLTNSRYLSFMDLGRLDFFYHSGLWSWNKDKSVFPILQSVEISFIRSIMPGEVTVIHTQILGTDKKYCYIQQQFTVKGKLVADARIRAVLCNGFGQVLQTEALSQHEFSNHTLGSIEQWKIYLSLKTEDSRKT